MGTDNIYVKFGTDADQDKWTEAEWTQIADIYNTETGSVIVYQSANFGGFYKQLLRNTPNATYDVAVRMHFTCSSAGHQSVAWVKLNDGNFYCFGPYANSAFGASTGSEKRTVRPTTGYNTLVSDGLANVSCGTISWIGLRFHTNGNVDTLIGDNNNDGRDPPNMSVAKVNAQIGATGAKIIEIGLFAPAVPTWYSRLYVEADLSTPEGGDATFVNIKSINSLSSIGGGGAATIVESYDPFDANALDHVRANARKSVVVYRPDGPVGFKGEIDKITIGYDTITYQAEEGLRKLNDSFCNINPVVFKSDLKTSYNKVIFDEFTNWTVNDYANKLLITRDPNLYDKTDFPYAVEANKVVVDLVTFAETWTPAVPNNEGGGFEKQYFHDENEVSDVYGSHYDDAKSAGHRYTIRTYDKDFRVQTNVDIDVDNGSSKGTLTRGSGSWITEGHEVGDSVILAQTANGNDGTYVIDTLTALVMTMTTVIAGTDSGTDNITLKRNILWDKIDLKVISRFTSFKKSLVFSFNDEFYPTLMIYNYLTTDWDLINLYSRDVDGDGNQASEAWNTASIEAASNASGKSPILDKDFNLLTALSVTAQVFKATYMEEQGDANASGFSEYELQIRLRSPRLTTLALNPKLEVHYLGVNFVQDNAQLSPQGQALTVGVIASNDVRSITMDGTAGWELSTFPQGDGVTVGDEYIITDTIQNVLTAIFAADPIFSISQTISVADLGETEDLTDTPKYDVLQKYSDMLNLVFWYDPTETTDVIKIVDALVSSGIILTILDVVGWHEDSWKLTLDSSQLREKIKYVGDEGLSTEKLDGTDYNVDFGPSLGDEDVIYRDSELYTQRNVDQAATSKQNLHSTVRETIPLPVDLQTRVQSYTVLTVGSTVAFTGSILGDYDSGNLGELMVESISIAVDYEMSDKITVIFNLQKRVI